MCQLAQLLIVFIPKAMKAGGHASLGMAASESIHMWQLTTPLSKQQEMAVFITCPLVSGMVLRPILLRLLVAYWLKAMDCGSKDPGFQSH